MKVAVNVSFKLRYFNFNTSTQDCGSRDSAVGVATGYRLDDRVVRFRVPVGSRISSLLRSVTPTLGPSQPFIQWVTGALSAEVKRPGSEADHSHPTSAEVKKGEYIQLQYQES
jgi:hypothetical protein